MPSWGKLVTDIDAMPDGAAKAAFVQSTMNGAISTIEKSRGRNVIVYASAFLQKPQVPPNLLQITHEDINGLMTAVHGMDCSKGLSLVLHTPGGVTVAAETIVAYLTSKFDYIEVIVPTFAMSAGTMIALAANQILMGRQSQLGPIDPQMPYNGRMSSARAILGQFEMAKAEIIGDRQLAHAWAPVLTHYAPSIIIEARNALDYGERMVAGWLSARMFAGAADPVGQSKDTAKHFNDADVHKSHGRRIGRDEARRHNVDVLDLESDQILQDAALTLYHVLTILFERSPAVKWIGTKDPEHTYIKHFNAQPMNPGMRA